MIAGIKGIIEAIGSNWVIVNVGGISFQVFLPTSTLATLGPLGRETRLFTHLHVREDNLTLFGFGSGKEMTLFETLIGVKGIGPKLGLAMLSALEPDQLIVAIAGGDFNLLASVPGIGKKTAERIVLELKDKITGSWALTQDIEAAQDNREVVEALTSLGYSVAEATRAAASLKAGNAGATLEDKIKQALQYFSAK